MKIITFVKIVFIWSILVVILIEPMSILVTKVLDLDKSKRSWSDIVTNIPLEDDVDLDGLMESYSDFYVIYDPYIGFKNLPNYKSLHLNTDDHGRRKTLGDNKESKYQIAFFGGSTAFGVGAETDNHTIPSYLYKYFLNRCGDHKFKVINFGVGGSNQTQSLISFLDNINLYDIDLLISYDFVNESLHSYRELWSHNLVEFEYPERFLVYGEPLFKYKKNNIDNSYFETIKSSIKKLTTYSLLRRVYYHYFTEWGSEIRSDKEKKYKLESKEQKGINKAISNYLTNIEIFQSLENQFRFKSFFFLQPTLYTKQTLSETELSSEYSRQFKYAYYENSLFDSVAVHTNNEYFFDLRETFDNTNETIFIDDHHTYSKGNKIIAENIFNRLINQEYVRQLCIN